jgi:two-component system sensor histidine kinase KdpD
MVAATRYGMHTGAVTGLVSSLAYNFFFIPPTHTFTIQDPQNIITVLVLLGVAAVSSQLAARVREQALLAQHSATQNSALAGFARLLTGISKGQELAQVLCAEIGRLLDVHAVLLMPEGNGLALRSAWPPEDRLETLEQAAARWAFENNRPAGEVRTPDRQRVAVPADRRGGRALAVFGLARRRCARTDPLGPAAAAAEPARPGRPRARTDRARDGNGGHLEARRSATPQGCLALVGESRLAHTADHGAGNACASCEGEHGRRGRPARKPPRARPSGLHRFVGNLLDMVRIEGGRASPTTEPVDLTEAVASATHDLRGALQDHAVKLDTRVDLPFVLSTRSCFTIA